MEPNQRLPAGQGQDSSSACLVPNPALRMQFHSPLWPCLTENPEIPSPAWVFMGQSATFLPGLYPLKQNKPYSPGKFCLKHAGGRQHCLTGCNVFALKGFIFYIFRYYDGRYNFPQVGHMPSTLCRNDLENIFT